ncbi:MAG: phospholipase D-like domain-containing protein [bacterium]
MIEKLLGSAKESIIIQTQYINDPSLIDILMNKKLKLPEIKILVSNTTASTEMEAYMGDLARKEKKEYLHAKMILIDHKILLLGSMNLSANSLDKNREI